MKSPDSRKPLQTLEAMGFVWDTLFVIAVPTTLCALGGRWLDRYFQSSPLFVILGLVLALILAAFMVLRQAKRYKKLFE